MDTTLSLPPAFELLYARYGPRILAYAFSWLHDRHAAEDVLQEVFTRLHQQMARPAAGGGASADVVDANNGGAADFLFGVARSRIIDQLRRRDVRAGTVRLTDAPEPEGVGPTRMDGPVERAEVHRLVNRALLALPDEQREAVVLRIFGRFSFQAISRLTGAPLPTVASRYRYALGKMAPMLKELWVEA